jgi:hypothetical protein
MTLKLTILLTGDICIDWLQFPTKPKDSGLNWELYPGTRMTAKPGGALLLAEFLRSSTDAAVISPQLENIENIPPEEILHSNAELDLFPYSLDSEDKNNLVYRIRHFRGFTGPAAGLPGLLPLENDDSDADIVILDDAGNGFRSQKEYWPCALTAEGKKPVVIYKMSRPLAQGELWEHLQRFHSERLVAVVTADDLRASGVNISRCLSWERTAMDFVWQTANNPRMLSLSNCANLVVRFGLEGAIHCTKKGGKVESRLYFDPSAIEDGLRDKCPGDMQGISSAFTAALAARIASQSVQGKELYEAASAGVRDGIIAARLLFRHGFGNIINQPEYPSMKIFEPAEHDSIADIIIPAPSAAETADPDFWCILKEIKDMVLEDIAYDIVIKGETAALKQAPVGSFGKLRTADRAEIESFRCIRNVMQEYINSKSTIRPLSIAVFGFPGSGKSFGVTEVAESVAPGQVVRLDFNVSQFISPSDLINVFHKARDIALEGKIPLVFFDEFDSPFEGKLGWLKYFLAPMQDGTFRDGESVHPIGKSIFVFAGGINSTFAGFSQDELKGPEKEQEFKNAKVPDFISRLRGYVNILGPDPADSSESVFIIRRAMLLRSLLQRKAKQLFDSNNHVRIDAGVLRALIKVPGYKHGARSIEAIIDMSMLNGRTRWEQAFLPAKEQLKLHVDDETFSRLVVRDVLFGAARETLAKTIHENYLKDQEGKKPASDPSMQPWEKLNENLKESNRRQADHIPEKLRRVRCGFVSVTDIEPVKFEFTPAEIEILAEMEHDRWVSERLFDGWVYGEKREIDKKISPYIVPWKDLTEDVKEWDRDAMRRLPELLAKAKFEIYRLD